MKRIPGELAAPAGARLVPTGMEFDAICVPRYLALPSLTTLGKTGAVIVNPYERALYFFAQLGTAASWDVPETHPLGAAQYLLLPPAASVSPPGPYWLVKQGADGPLTDANRLHAALQSIIADGNESRAVVR